MTETLGGDRELVQFAGSLRAQFKIGAELPAAVRTELALLPDAQRVEFLKAYHLQSCSLLLAYLASLIYCHYGLLVRWAMTGMMFLTLPVAVTLGWIWWLIDAVRMPGIVRAHNQRVAAEILRRLALSSEPALPLTVTREPAAVLRLRMSSVRTPTLSVRFSTAE